MNFKELDKLHSDYLNACESEFEMGKVFELAKKGLYIEQIRAEIEEYKSTIDNAISEDELKIEGMQEAYNDCLDIIDKYK